MSVVVGKNNPAVRRCKSMAKCAICEKGAHFGIAVSHSHRRTNKKWNSNVKSVRVNINFRKFITVKSGLLSATHFFLFKRILN